MKVSPGTLAALRDELGEDACNQPGRASETVANVLEEAIVRGYLRPGAHLTEAQVSVALAVSRTPVREAFRALERDGWLTVQPYAGVSVRYPSRAQLHDTFELRQGLEEWSIELSCLRINEEQLNDLERIVCEGLDACDRLDFSAMSRLNWQFHITLHRANGNEALERSLGQLQRQIEWHFHVGAGEVGLESWREHQAILVAVRARDIRTARELIRHHILRTREYFFAHLTDELE